MSRVNEEIATEPAVWRRAAKMAPAQGAALPRDGMRLGVAGAGTSLYMAEAYAVLRERRGAGETDAFTPTEVPPRTYDAVLAITRSGTTTEILRFLEQVPEGTRKLAITGTAGSPVFDLVDGAVLLDFADEESVVQTRFATAVLALLRARLGDDVEALAAAADEIVAAPLPVDPAAFRQFVYLGTGFAVGLAHEAALKMREAAGGWTEAYPATEFRHGPISVLDERSCVWMLNEPPAGLEDAVRQTGATFVNNHRDPMVELVLAQRAAVRLAEARGLDPDHPRHLSRSVILPDISRAGGDEGEIRRRQSK